MRVIIPLVCLLSFAPSAQALDSPTSDYANDVIGISRGAGLEIANFVMFNVTWDTLFDAYYARANLTPPVSEAFGAIFLQVLTAQLCIWADQVDECLLAEMGRAPEFVTTAMTAEEALAGQVMIYADRIAGRIDGAAALAMRHTAEGGGAIVARTIEYLDLS